MTIKKPIKVTASKAASEETAVASAAPGGATIADRFKLDAPPAAKKAAGGPAATAAAIAGLLALAVAGILVYVLYQHREFLMPA